MTTDFEITVFEGCSGAGTIDRNIADQKSHGCRFLDPPGVCVATFTVGSTETISTKTTPSTLTQRTPIQVATTAFYHSDSDQSESRIFYLCTGIPRIPRQSTPNGWCFCRSESKDDKATMFPPSLETHENTRQFCWVSLPILSCARTKQPGSRLTATFVACSKGKTMRPRSVPSAASRYCRVRPLNRVPQR